MGSILQLSEARKNLSELVNEAYYQGRLFGISKGKKPMGVFIGIREWKEIIEIVKKHKPDLARRLSLPTSLQA